jgi:hypothetical protein
MLKYVLILSLFLCGVSYGAEKIKVSKKYEAVYSARQIIDLPSVEVGTKEVIVYVLVGALVYTLDGTVPVLTNGTNNLAIGEGIKLTKNEAISFKAACGMQGTKICVLFLE